MKVTDLKVELRPVNRLHHHLIVLQGKNTTIESLEIHQGEARGTMPWERHSSRYPAPLFFGVLSRPSSLVASTFTIYNGKTNHVEHVSHFNQRMVIHSKNKVLMCKVFPSSLGLVAMR